MNEQELYQLWLQQQRNGETMDFDEWKIARGYAGGVSAENPFLPSTTVANPLAGQIDAGLAAGVNRASGGGNTDQIQGGFQEGAFNTQGQTQQSQTSGQAVTGEQTQTGTSTQNQTQQTGGTQTTSGAQYSSGFSDLINKLTSSGVSAEQAKSLATSLQQQVGTTEQAGVQSATGGRTVTDPYGFGQLLASQAGGAATQDAARTAFLQDVMQTGGTGFNEQVQAAINNSLSGPGMQGVGTMAQGRTAGAASADIARNSMAQRLQAAGQLAQPGSVQNLVSAGTPFLGENNFQNTQNKQVGTQQTTTEGREQQASATTGQQSQTQTQAQNQITGQNVVNTGTQSNTGFQNTQQSGATTNNQTNNQNTVGFADLVSNESQSGDSTAASRQVATGKIPEGSQTQSGGGCVVCTAYVDLGMMHPGAIRKGVEFKLRNFPKYRSSIRAYMAYGPYLARLVFASQTFRRWFRPIARAILYQECRLAAPRRLPRRLGASFCHWVFDVALRPLGWFASGRVRDEKILEVLKRNNLMFTWEDSK